MSTRVAFVIPWYGEQIKGGAEQQTWQIATRLAARGHPVEVLSTCCPDFHDDWASNGLRAGESVESGVTVRRFPVEPRDRLAFDEANRKLLALSRQDLLPGVAPLADGVAQAFVRENIHSSELQKFLVDNRTRYKAIVFVPYLYGTTFYGLPLVADRAWLLPCLHDEAYAYLPEVSELFRAAKGILFNSGGEAALAARLYGPSIWAKGVVTGEGIESEAFTGDLNEPLPAELGSPFLLYLGRRDSTKNTDFLVRAFNRYCEAHPLCELRLVLAGPGRGVATSQRIIDLGLVDESLKMRLLKNCLALVQPSLNESFSRTMMEAWQQGRPVVVHRRGLATARSVAACKGGLTADDRDEWIEVFEQLSEPVRSAEFDAMGERGRQYAARIANWDGVLDHFEEVLELKASSAGSSSSRPRSRKARAIHQLLVTLSPGDAIGNYTRALRSWLRAQGFRSEIYCMHLDPRLEDVATRLKASHLHPEDALIYHHSIGSEITKNAVSHSGPKLLIYHNITPSHFFAPYRPEFSKLLDNGYAELRDLVASFQLSVGDSAVNAASLKEAGFSDPGVLPIAVDPSTWNEVPDPEWMRWLQDGSTNVLFVGRLAPNKRQEDLIAAFTHLLKAVPSARLILLGHETPDDPYARCLHVLADELGVASRIVFTGEVSTAQLQACFRTAQLYWSMSEHEGFGVPLVEAMWFDIPVLAFESTAVPETLGEAGLLFSSKRWPELARLAEDLLFDEKLRETVLCAQRQRRQDFLPESLRPILEKLIERMLGFKPSPSTRRRARVQPQPIATQ